MKILKWVGLVTTFLVIVVVGSVFYLKSAAAQRLDQEILIEAKSVPIPFPLTDQEIAQLAESGWDEEALKKRSLEQAIARGKHYVDSRAACSECHGKDFGGKVIVDSPVMGKWIAPNITRGGLTKDYKAVDWVRIVRHGVKPNNRPAIMPSEDYSKFSDQEISDIAAYISSLPPVSRVMKASELGPIFSLLIVNGEMPISAEVINHKAPRPIFPPALVANQELGSHLIQVCVGCHGAHLSGGPIPGGDPKWPAAANLTFDETGLFGWSLDDFKKSLREGVRPDGTNIDPAMPVAYTRAFKDEEIEALYLHLQKAEKRPFGQR